MKMPEPIIAPMTSMVASSTPMSRSSAPAFAALGVGSVPAVVMALFSILSLEELRDIGDRLAEGLPSPVGQGRVHGQGKLVDEVRRGLLPRLAVGADLGEVPMVDLRGLSCRAGRRDPPARVVVHERAPSTVKGRGAAALAGGRGRAGSVRESIPGTEGPRSELIEEPDVILV